MGDNCLDGICDCIGGMIVGVLCCPCLSIMGCISALYPEIQNINKIVEGVFEKDLLSNRDIGINLNYINNWLQLGYKYEDNPQIKCTMSNYLRDVIWKQVHENSLITEVTNLTRHDIQYIVKQIRYYLQMSILCYYEKHRVFWNSEIVVDGKSAKAHVGEFLKTWERSDRMVAECSVMLQYSDHFKEFNMVPLEEDIIGWKGMELNTSLGLRFRDNISRVEIDGEKSRIDYNSTITGVVAGLRKIYADIVLDVLQRSSEEKSPIYADIIAGSIKNIKVRERWAEKTKMAILNGSQQKE